MMPKYHPFFRKILNGLALVLSLSLIASLASAAEYRTVRKDGVNIRSGPSTKDEIYWEVFKGFPLKIVSSKGNWSKTEDFEGDGGWIYSPLLSKTKKVIVKVKKANLRIGPGKNYEITASALYGVVFKPGKKDGYWLQVSHGDGTKGWIHKSLVWP